MLVSCRLALRTCVKDLLDLTFPVEDSLGYAEFHDEATRSVVFGRLDDAHAHSEALAQLFLERGVEPAGAERVTAETDGLPKAMREMLVKAVAEEAEKRQFDLRHCYLAFVATLACLVLMLASWCNRLRGCRQDVAA